VIPFRVIFLGTGAARATAERNLSATLVRHGSELTLVDCGEGTQRQLDASIHPKVEDIDRILLTHTHHDHCFGLPGLLGMLASRGRKKPLTIYGPPGFVPVVRSLLAFVKPPEFDLRMVEFTGGEEVYGCEGYALACFRTRHTIYSLGWTFTEPARPGRFDIEEARRRGCPDGPLLGALRRGDDVRLPDGTAISAAGLTGSALPGRKLVLSGDSEPCAELAAATEGADLLVHEATFARDAVTEARVSRHSTSVEAAERARASGVGLLALTHISPRYLVEDLVAEAREVHEQTVGPSDFDLIEIGFAERGGAELIGLAGKRRATRVAAALEA
jgi:ribonuclease Z